MTQLEVLSRLRVQRYKHWANLNHIGRYLVTRCIRTLEREVAA